MGAHIEIFMAKIHYFLNHKYQKGFFHYFLLNRN